MLQQIGLHLNSLRRFPRLYPHNDRLATAMVDVYRIIFRFCTEARNVIKKVSAKKTSQKGRPCDSGAANPILRLAIGNHLVGFQSGIKVLWKPFKAQFGDLQIDLAHSMDRVSKEVDIAEKE